MKDSHQQLSSKGLHKRYGKRWVVRDVDLNVNKGEIVGLLGPNGAGKTTTMRAITGYLIPTEGEGWVAECNMRNDPLQARQHIGYLPETIPLYTDMTTRDYLSFAAKLRGLDSKAAQRGID